MPREAPITSATGFVLAILNSHQYSDQKVRGMTIHRQRLLVDNISYAVVNRVLNRGSRNAGRRALSPNLTSLFGPEHCC